MKNVITAIGDKKLNDILKSLDEIDVKTSDILYQEGVIEALDKYPDIDIIILSEEIIGIMDIKDIVRNIILLKEDIEIILITKERHEVEEIKQITKIVDIQKDYVKEILKYLKQKSYINIKNETKSIEEVKNESIYIESYNTKMEDDKIKSSKIYKERKVINKKRQIITVIGSSGVRKNNIYFNTC